MKRKSINPKSGARKRPSSTRRAPRTAPYRLVVQLIADLCGRLSDAHMGAKAMSEMIAPTPDMKWGEWKIRKFFEAAAKANQAALSDARGLADIIHENATRGRRLPRPAPLGHAAPPA